MQISLVGQKPNAQPQVTVDNDDISILPDSELGQLLLELGFDAEGVVRLVPLLMPMVQEFLLSKFVAVFTNIDMLMLTQVADEQNFDADQLDEMYQLAYAEKTGKTLTAELKEFFADLTASIRRSMTDWQAIVAEVEQLPENQREAKVDELVSAKLASYE